MKLLKLLLCWMLVLNVSFGLQARDHEEDEEERWEERERRERDEEEGDEDWEEEEDEWDEEEIREWETEMVRALMNLEPAAVPMMQKLRATDIEEYYEILEDVHESLEECEEMSKEDPAAGKLCRAILQSEIRIAVISEQYRTAKDAKMRAALKGKMEAQVAEAFTLRMKEGEMELQYIMKEMEELKKEIEVRKTHAKEIIQRRVREELGEEDHLEW